MSNSKLKSFFCLLILFMFDITVPLHFIFDTEFLMLGLIFLALRMPLGFILPMAVFFGMVKDAFMLNTMPSSTLIFICTVMLMWYLKKHFRKKLVFEALIVFIAIVFNLVVNSMVQEVFSPLFSFSFILQSLVVFILLDIVLKRWIPGQSQEDIA